MGQPDPLITAQPQDVATNVGKVAKFSVSLTGTMPMTNTWFFNLTNSGYLYNSVSSNLTGSTTFSLSVTAAAPATVFAVIYSNARWVTSRVATLTILPTPLSITSQPTNVTASVGSTATFRVTAAGTAPLSYQWFFNGAGITKGTNSILTVTNISASDAGGYNVNVSDSSGSVTSVTATLTVRTTPTITKQPTNVTANFGANATLSVTASGAAPLSYQWFFNGSSIAGAAGSNLVLTNVSASDAGGYSVVITNSYGSVTSVTATLTVKLAPAITTQPATNIIAAPGTNVTFSVVASGAPPLSYQWFFNGTGIGSATDSALVLTNVSTNDSGAYSVLVTNTYGSTTSRLANLTVAYQSQTPATVTLISHSITNGDIIRMSSLTAGNNYTVQDSSNLLDWQGVLSFMASTSQRFYTNRQATNVAWFYRISSP